MDYDYESYDTYLEDTYDYGVDVGEISEMTLHQVYESCLKPSVLDSLKSVSHVLFWCFVYRLSTKFFRNTSLIHHIISIITGLLSLHVLFSSSVYYIVSLIILTYAFLFIFTYFQFVKHQGAFLLLISLSFLCVCELWLVNPKKWHRIRGSQMIVVMKSVSLAFDLDIGTVKKIPNLILYTGYILCPGSCVFGPWVTYNDYEYSYKGSWSFKSVFKIFLNFLLAIFFLSISTCWCDYFIPQENWKWFSAYREALSFRAGHYFISYLSEITLLLSGFSSMGFNGVSKPHMVEIPRSLVNVVIYWNIPMHNFLKIYVFKTSRKFGNFFAILSTYAVSSIIHGLNFQISAVLLSLGVYSYIEVMLRKKLAGAFDACILAKECKAECSHIYKKYHPLVILTNFCFLLLTVFHLAYLGVVFETSPEEETGYSWKHSLKEWSNLNYLSHYIAFLTFLMYILIK